MRIPLKRNAPESSAFAVAVVAAVVLVLLWLGKRAGAKTVWRSYLPEVSPA